MIPSTSTPGLLQKLLSSAATVASTSRRPGVASSDMPRAGTHGPASFSSARFDHGTRRRTYPVTVPARPSEREVDEFLTRAMSQVIVKEDLAKQLRSGERQLRIKQG